MTERLEPEGLPVLCFLEAIMGGSGVVGAGQGGPSGTPLAKKIGIKAGHRVGLRHAPGSFGIPGLPPDVELGVGGPRGVDVTLAFFRAREDLAAEASGLVAGLGDDAMLWIAWPRKAAGHASDIAENDLRDLFLPLGVVDVKVAALGEDWSGLKFVRRRENRRADRRDRPKNRRT